MPFGVYLMATLACCRCHERWQKRGAKNRTFRCDMGVGGNHALPNFSLPLCHFVCVHVQVSRMWFVFCGCAMRVVAQYFEVSARDNINVRPAFMDVVTRAVARKPAVEETCVHVSVCV